MERLQYQLLQSFTVTISIIYSHSLFEVSKPCDELLVVSVERHTPDSRNCG